MKTLSIDIETYSPVSLPTAGVYRYADDPDFDILLFAYSIDGKDPHVVSLATGEEIPEEILDWLTDPAITKWAYNASFERVCLSAWLHKNGHTKTRFINPKGWRCSMVATGAIGLPLGLKNVGQALKLDAQKIDAGKDLINYFCIPKKAPPAENTLFNTDHIIHRNTPQSAPEKWSDFIEYNRRDVEVENQLRTKIRTMSLPDFIWREYETDQLINDTGVKIDTDFAQAAITIDTTHKAHVLDEARELTGLDNPNSPTALHGWLTRQGTHVESMAKDDVADALQSAAGAPRRVLELRQEMSRSSVKKYQAMLNSVCADGRAHGLLQFHGAGRTGRWAGRLIQVQNLPRNYLADLEDARNLVAAGDGDIVEMLYDSVPDTLSQLVRTAFIPEDDHRFIVADYSAIEARVLAWLAGEESTLQAFRRGDDLYCATASQMFGVPVEKHGQNADLRQRGKVATLACGYQGGIGAIKAMGGERMGMTDIEMKDTVTKWRAANPHIVNFWWDIERAVKDTLASNTATTVGPLTIDKKSGALTITLPSGRDLVYPGARLGKNRFGDVGIVFQGIGLNKKAKSEETYGGKLVENITQAVARDLLAHALSVVSGHRHRIVMHVHDEIVVEAPPETSVDQIVELMTQAPKWAEGLPLDADGYECSFYQKD